MMNKEDPAVSVGVKQRATQLFQYLHALADLRTRMVRDIAAYESVFWFCDLPREPECSTAAWVECEEDGEDVWLKIQKPAKPEVPDPPEACSAWIDRELFEDTDQEPVLLEEIVKPDTDAVDSGEDGQPEEVAPVFLHLRDYPEIRDAWENYIEMEWKPWAVEFNRWKRVQGAYRQLFAIYQHQRRRGEQFELVLGVGTLLWHTESDHRVFRPIITARASLALEPEAGTISVFAAADGAEFSLEEDMLELDERPPVDQQKDFEEPVSTITNILDRESVVPILKAWVNSLPSAESVFHDQLEPPGRSGKSPQMAFAPVLMLRKRSGQTLCAALKKILLLLQGDKPVPRGIRELCGDYGGQVIAGNAGSGAASIAGDAGSGAPPEEILFPLPANEEQYDILRRLRGKSGILVQGPPGTGKSHTIVNLICHFLANNKRVLVTSQTPRALEVLRKKMEEHVEDILPLCVSVLGNDPESQRNLEFSVQGILRRVNSWNPTGFDREFKETSRQRTTCLAALARLRRTQAEMREAETRACRIPDTQYAGTLQAITIQVQRETETLNWIPDTIQDNTQPPLAAGELEELAGLWHEIDRESFAVLEQHLPTPESLPTAADFETGVRAYQATQDNAKQQQALPFRVGKLAQLEAGKLRELSELGCQCIETRESLSKRRESWVSHAVEDILAGHDRPWRILEEGSRGALVWLAERAKQKEPSECDLPPSISRDRLLADAKDLCRHLSEGAGFGFWIFRPATAKNTEYLWKYYRYGGRLCNTPEVLRELIGCVEQLDLLDRVWKEWSAHTEVPGGTFRHRKASLEEHHEALQIALRLADLAENVATILKPVEIGSKILTGEDWAETLVRDTSAALTRLQEEAPRKELENLSKPVIRLSRIRNLHPLTARLVEAVREFDAASYRDLLCELAQATRSRSLIARCCELDGRLRECAPQLASCLEADASRAEIASKLGTFERAWAWKRAAAWLEAQSQAHSTGVAEGIAHEEERLHKLTGALAAHKAWQSCHEHLNDNPQKQSALLAWQEAHKKIGGGYSKYIETYRRDARKFMRQCRSAIPAWIMPLYRVAEAIEVEPEVFDVVIVDEASQTGPEGLLLQYLGEQCVVVGDDKQISPEAVGINLGQVRALMQHHLQDFPFAETLHPTSSLFSQASVRYGNRVTLREHFRCMPEIIRFSNDVCYHDTPLIPLRQYPPDRLPPIRVSCVVDGFREGTGQKVVNRPEAGALAAAVVECLNDSRYDDKTMGVICLQGHAQAKLIEKMLLDSLGPEPFEQRQLICGDPYSFQGDERDVVFLSMVAASGGETRLTPLTRESFRQRFNVAASRARDQTWLFHSVSEGELNGKCMRRKLLSHYYNPGESTASVCDVAAIRAAASAKRRSEATVPDPFDSWFEVDVFLQLVSKGYTSIPQFPVAGKRIDLVVVGKESRVAVECDGDRWHGPDRYEEDMARQRMLERSGWKFLRIRGSVFYANQAKCISRVVEALAGHGIGPGQAPDASTTVRSWTEELSGIDCISRLGWSDIEESEPARSARGPAGEEAGVDAAELPTDPLDTKGIPTHLEPSASDSKGKRRQTEPSEAMPPASRSTDLPQRSEGALQAKATREELEKHTKYAESMQQAGIQPRKLKEWLDQYRRTQQRE